MLPRSSKESNDQHDMSATLDTAPIEFPENATGCLMPRPKHGDSLFGRMRRQQEFEDCRRCADVALKLLDCEDRVQTGPNRTLVWPGVVTGSIAHSENFVWAVAGPQFSFRAIGIDTEPIADEKTIGHLRAEIGTGSEWRLGELAGLTPAAAFTTIYSAKESLYHCVYSLNPVFFGFLAIRVVDIDPQHVTLQFQPECPNQYLGNGELDVAYKITAQDVFTACWLTAEKGIR